VKQLAGGSLRIAPDPEVACFWLQKKRVSSFHVNCWVTATPSQSQHVFFLALFLKFSKFDELEIQFEMKIHSMGMCQLKFPTELEGKLVDS